MCATGEKSFFREFGKSVKPFEKLIPKIKLKRICEIESVGAKLSQKVSLDFRRLYNWNGWSGLASKTHECLWQADPNHPIEIESFLNEIKNPEWLEQNEIFPFSMMKEEFFLIRNEKISFPWALKE